MFLSLQPDETPIKRVPRHKERESSRTHFEFADDGTPEGEKRPHGALGKAHNTGLGLYSNHVVGDDDTTSPEKGAAPLKTQNQNTLAAAHRRKDFTSHWDSADSPVATDAYDSAPQKRDLTASNKRVLGNLDSHWEMYDEEPEVDEVQSKKENIPKAAMRGDGMGGRKNAQRTWGFGDDSDNEAEQPLPVRKKQEKKSEEKSWWDF